MQNQVEPREALLRLEFRAGSPNHPRSSRLSVECGDIEQRGLADTSVAEHQQRPTADSRIIYEPADELDVRIPPDELSGSATAHGRLPSSQPQPRLRGPQDPSRSGSRRRLHDTAGQMMGIQTA